MIIQLRKKIKELRQDDEGAAIIVVLVTMTFIVVLVAILLYMSLINIQMKKMDKDSKANFYSAEAVLNEVRAGVQAAVSNAIKSAYSNVLVSYNTDTKDNQTKNFVRMFYENLYGTTILNPHGLTSSPLFDQNGTLYDPRVLLSFISYQSGDITAEPLSTQLVLADGTKIVISGSSIVQEAADRSYTVLKGVMIRYTAKGYDTTVSSDIKISRPDLPYTSTTVTQTAAPDFSLIARGLLSQPAGAGTVSITGNTCMGGLTVGGSGDEFYVTNAPYFVSMGPVNINGGMASFNLNSSLWASNITLDSGGRVTIAGDAYIANDLNLLGNNTQAVLSGRYFGYGDSGSDQNLPIDPNASSAILINGKNTVLDMSSLRALILAGRSFVNYSSGADGYVMTGESISVKSNQLAYLVPESNLAAGITNPYVYTTDPGNAVLQTYIRLDSTLASYGITSVSSNIKYIRKSVGATNLVYFCYNFLSTDNANRYFRDYYNANGAAILKYLDIYSNGISLYSAVTKNLAGDAYTFNGTLLGPIIDASSVPAATVSEISSSYKNLGVTLNRSKPGSEATAYDYFVDTAKLATLSGSKIFSVDGVPRVLVINGDYSIDANTDSNIHIVIASGNVTVQRNFTGLIFAGGTATLYKSVTADRTAVSDALSALSNDEDGDGIYTYNYLNPQHISPFNSTAHNNGSGDIWNMNALVTYDNWEKNAA